MDLNTSVIFILAKRMEKGLTHLHFKPTKENGKITASMGKEYTKITLIMKDTKGNMEMISLTEKVIL